MEIIDLTASWGVVLGTWWALLVDLIGNYVGQGHPAEFRPIITGTVFVIVLTTAASKWHLVRRLRYE